MKLKQKNASAHNPVQVQDPWWQSKRNQLWRDNSFKSAVKGRVEGVIDDESEGDDCDEVNQWTEWGWQNEEEGWFHR